jgi:hypothetical protein
VEDVLQSRNRLVTILDVITEVERCKDLNVFKVFKDEATLYGKEGVNQQGVRRW